MKPVRTIEKLAYGEGTPDGLADMVPKWEDLWDSPCGEGEIWIGNCEDRVFSVEETPHGIAVNAPSPLEARWLAGCIVAHKAGCPPHWVDMGFTFEEGFVPNFGVDQIVWSFRSLHDGTRRRRFSVHADSPNPNNGNRWEVIAARVDGHPIKGAHRFFNTELEARQYAYDLIKEMEQ